MTVVKAGGWQAAEKMEHELERLGRKGRAAQPNLESDFRRWQLAVLASGWRWLVLQSG